MNKRILHLTAVLLLGIGFVGFGRSALTASAFTAPAANRSADPVVISGADLSDFISTTITHAVAFAYNGSWQAIPFQIDEKMIEPDDTEPDYVRYEDGLIDANDELVFMAQDTGVAETSWPNDAAARSHPRLAITIDDQLGQTSGVVYLYNSATLARSNEEYVTLDATNETVTAISYTVDFDSATLLGISDFFLNGAATDLLDRQKIRAEVQFFGTATEEDFAAQINPLTSIVTGPVRLVEGGDFGFAFYGARFDATIKLNIEQFEQMIGGLQIQSLRISLDHNPPAQTGVSNYFDSNVITATIDGVADPVNNNLRDWYQVSGGALGGYVATIPQLTIDSGSISTYYEEDITPSNDTGDVLQYADTGIAVASPSGNLQSQQVIYVLPPNTVGNMGAEFYQQAITPLGANIASETFSASPTAIALHGQTVTTVPQITVVAFTLFLMLTLWGKLRIK